MRVSTPLGRLSWRTVLLANVAFWPTWTLAVGYVVERVPRASFDDDDLITALRDFERSGRWYEDRLAIGAWKDRLPEAGEMFGGFPKRQVVRDRKQLERFVSETRRAEHAHWAMTSGALLTLLWNPWWAFPLNTSIAAASNLPCIAIQRHNRARLLRLLARQRAATSAR